MHTHVARWRPRTLPASRICSAFLEGTALSRRILGQSSFDRFCRPLFLGEKALDRRGVILLVDDYVETVDGVGVVSFVRRKPPSRANQLVGDIRRVTRVPAYRTPRSNFEVGVAFTTSGVASSSRIVVYHAVATRVLPVPPTIDAPLSVRNCFNHRWLSPLLYIKVRGCGVVTF